jgi:hypothetical protein
LSASFTRAITSWGPAESAPAALAPLTASASAASAALRTDERMAISSCCDERARSRGDRDGNGYPDRFDPMSRLANSAQRVNERFTAPI